MTLADLTAPAQQGLRKWAADTRNDEHMLDELSDPKVWAWIWFQLRAAPDRPEWFVHGKWATLQHIEKILTEDAIGVYRKY